MQLHVKIERNVLRLPRPLPDQFQNWGSIGAAGAGFLDFLPDLQLYVIASMGVALLFDAIRGLF